MSSRYRSDPESLDSGKLSACANFLRYSWKTIKIIFSHATLISMVVSYCYLGAVTFEALEVEHEKEVKNSIRHIRDNTTLHLWNFTQEMDALKEENFVPMAEKYLKDFENSLLKSMTKDGWDGEEDPEKVQWTMAGALFYSIVVITTIGYGHLTPKTNWGKVVTIFYAILGIPLMLLCLSNIGDIMATSFRFLYWRVCCYICQKKPKKRQRGRSFRASRHELSRSKSATSFRRSQRTSGKSTDSGYGVSDIGHNYHSDTELRYAEEYNRRKYHARGTSLPPKAYRFSEITPPSRNELAPQRNAHNNRRGRSLDRRLHSTAQRIKAPTLEEIQMADAPVLCNKYVVGKEDGLMNDIPVVDKRAKSVPKSSNYLEPPRGYSPESYSERDDVSESRKTRRKIKPRRSRSPLPNSSPKMMTPLGYGQPNRYLDGPDSDEDEYDPYYEPNNKEKEKPVPIWLCVLLVFSYILAGAYLFKYWEGWDYLDAAYFCFITLTTIGFGDLVPASGVNKDRYHATISIALCSLYLLFGISLLAMSFNLVQEEVISNVKSVAITLGIIKTDDPEDLEDEEIYL